MTIDIVRPAQADGVRLYYRPNFNLDNGRIPGYFRNTIMVEGAKQHRLNVADANVAMMQFRLRRFFLTEAGLIHKRDTCSGMILKDTLMKTCFADWPLATKHVVGRFLRACVQYETNFQQQRPGGSKMFWRWNHPLEFVYAIDYLMLYWYPRLIEADGGNCKTTKDYEEELEVLHSQTEEEDRKLITALIEHKIR